MRRARARHWRPGAIDLAAYAVGAGIVAALLVSAVRSTSDAPMVSTGLVSTRAASTVAALAGVVAVLAAISSGVRGGPLALGSATVVLVLLAPVDRGVVLRGPATRQVLVAALAGASLAAAAWIATANQIARPRGNLEAWILAGASAGVACAGLAMVVAGLRLSGRIAFGLRAVVVGWWTIDADLGTVSSPMARVADVLVGAPDPVSLASLLIGALALALAGVLCIRGVSVEGAWRRTAAADQLRLAVGLNDLRTGVLVLRRRSQERPRSRPWLRVDGRWARRHPVAARSLRGLARWPLARVGRFVFLAVATGIALALGGRAPVFAVVACVAAYAAALDASDALAQELDHPDLRRGYPIGEGALSLLHVPVPLALMTAFCVIAGVVAGAATAPTVLAVALLASPAVALAAMAGAALTASRTARPLVTIRDFGLPPEVVVPRVALQLMAPLVPLLVTVVPMVLELRRSIGLLAVVHGLPGAAVSVAMLGFVLFRGRRWPLR